MWPAIILDKPQYFFCPKWKRRQKQWSDFYFTFILCTHTIRRTVIEIINHVVVGGGVGGFFLSHILQTSGEKRTISLDYSHKHRLIIRWPHSHWCYTLASAFVCPANVDRFTLAPKNPMQKRGNLHFKSVSMNNVDNHSNFMRRCSLQKSILDKSTEKTFSRPNNISMNWRTNKKSFS